MHGTYILSIPALYPTPLHCMCGALLNLFHHALLLLFIAHDDIPGSQQIYALLHYYMMVNQHKHMVFTNTDDCTPFEHRMFGVAAVVAHQRFSNTCSDLRIIIIKTDTLSMHEGNQENNPPCLPEEYLNKSFSWF